MNTISEIDTTGERIRQSRKNAGLTQRELGERLGVSASMIAQYENGLRNPKFETIDRIAKALNITMADVLCLDNPRANELLEDSAMKHPDSEVSVITHNNQLNPFDRDEILDGRMLGAFHMLNETGQNKAIEQVDLLTKIPEYKKDTE